MDEIVVKNFYGKILGYIKTLPNGDQEVKNFYGQILGYYKKSNNVTTDFSGKWLYQGNCLSALIVNERG